MALPFVTDSRRLTGASLVLGVPGAILEVCAPTQHRTKLRVLWRNYARKLLDRIGWEREQVVTRDQGGSQIFAVSAPIDGLLPATYVTEWAWEAALFRLQLGERPISLASICDDILSRIVTEAKPGLAALYLAAKRRGVTTLLEKELSLGEGENCKIYPLDDLPLPDEIAWHPKRRRIPIALVTGTNGKTTTVRLLAKMARTAGFSAGFCSTDYVQVGDEILQRDDYSGPTGARFVLRHPNTELAILEVARGGMLRRGLQVSDADVGLVTNVADDHLGENGVHTLDQLAEAKFTIVRGLAPDAPVVVNADDLHCRAYARRLNHPLIWFSLDRPQLDILKGKRARLGVCYVDDGFLVREINGLRESVIAVVDVPITFNGAARYNTANALAALATASALNLPIKAVRRSLAEFGREATDNPGRANVFHINGAQVIADYGHNPEGIAALLQASMALPAKRRLVAVGLAGDRSDDAARQVGALLGQLKLDRIIVKELVGYLRGRVEGELSGILLKTLHAARVSKSKISYVRTDIEAMAQTLAWLKPGDLAVLFLHEDLIELTAQLAKLSQAT